MMDCLANGIATNRFSLTHLFCYMSGTGNNEFAIPGYEIEYIAVLDALRTNTTLKKFCMDPFNTSYEKMVQSICGIILQNTTLKKLYTTSWILWQPGLFTANHAPLERAMELNTTLQRLYLHCRQDENAACLRLENQGYINASTSLEKRKRLMYWSAIKNLTKSV